MSLTPEQTDALVEVINIGIGRAAGSLYELLDSYVYLSVPSLRALKLSQWVKENAELGLQRHSSVHIDFQGISSGTAALVFPTESALNLVSALTGEELGTLELDTVRAGTLTEVGNIVLNGVVGTIGNILKHCLEFGLPNYAEDNIANIIETEEGNPDPEILIIRTSLTLKHLLISGDIIILFKLGSLDSLLKAIDNLDLDY